LLRQLAAEFRHQEISYPNDVAIAKRCASFPFQALIVANANPLGATGPDG
jgi:hypothetical protein